MYLYRRRDIIWAAIAGFNLANGFRYWPSKASVFLFVVGALGLVLTLVLPKDVVIRITRRNR